MGEIVKYNAEHYQSDLEIDKEIITDRMKNTSQGKSLYFILFSRKSGTFICDGKQAYMKDN